MAVRRVRLKHQCGPTYIAKEVGLSFPETSVNDGDPSCSLSRLVKSRHYVFLMDISSVCLNVLIHREGSLSVQPVLDILILNAMYGSTIMGGGVHVTCRNSSAKR